MVGHVVSDIFLRNCILLLVKNVLDDLSASFIVRVVESRVVPSDPLLDLVWLGHFAAILLRQVSLSLAEDVGTACADGAIRQVRRPLIGHEVAELLRGGLFSVFVRVVFDCGSDLVIRHTFYLLAALTFFRRLLLLLISLHDSTRQLSNGWFAVLAERL